MWPCLLRQGEGPGVPFCPRGLLEDVALRARGCHVVRVSSGPGGLTQRVGARTPRHFQSTFSVLRGLQPRLRAPSSRGLTQPFPSVSGVSVGYLGPPTTSTFCRAQRGCLTLPWDRAGGQGVKSTPCEGQGWACPLAWGVGPTPPQKQWARGRPGWGLGREEGRHGGRVPLTCPVTHAILSVYPL